MKRTRVIIMGAAGRDFHNFNTFFRGKEEYEVVAFTATQIPGIDDKTYPNALGGDLYPNGIPIYAESRLASLIKEHGVEKVVFSYSDVPHEYVMHKASEVMAAGADFWLLGPNSTSIKAAVPGAKLSDVDAAARSVIDEAGYGDAFIHGTGHPLGIEVHDVTPDGPLREGMVITVEPGVYFPERKMGIRIEDDVLITKTGAKNLTAQIAKTIPEVEAAMGQRK